MCLFPVRELFEWFITFKKTLKVQEIISPIFSWSCHICFFVSLIFTQMDTYVNKHCNYTIYVMLFNFFWYVRFTENLQERDKKFPYILPPANFPFYHICIFCVCICVCSFSPLNCLRVNREHNGKKVHSLKWPQYSHQNQEINIDIVVPWFTTDLTQISPVISMSFLAKKFFSWLMYCIQLSCPFSFL